MSKCARAGRDHSRTDSQAGQWKYSTPYTYHTLYEWGLDGVAGIFSLVFLEFIFSLVQEFGLFQEFFKICKKMKVQGSMITARGPTANQSSGGEKVVLYAVWFANSFLLSIVVVVLLLSY